MGTEISNAGTGRNAWVPGGDGDKKFPLVALSLSSVKPQNDRLAPKNHVDTMTNIAFEDQLPFRAPSPLQPHQIPWISVYF